MSGLAGAAAPITTSLPVSPAAGVPGSAPAAAGAAAPGVASALASVVYGQAQDQAQLASTQLQPTPGAQAPITVSLPFGGALPATGSAVPTAAAAGQVMGGGPGASTAPANWTDRQIINPGTITIQSEGLPTAGSASALAGVQPVAPTAGAAGAAAVGGGVAPNAQAVAGGRGANAAPAANQSARRKKKRATSTLSAGERSRWVKGDLKGLNSKLLDRLAQLGKALGKPIDIRSGLRSHGEQKRLYALYKAGRGNLAAPPGRSNHESGNAADAYVGGAALRDNSKAKALASRLGLVFPVAGESWHVELRR